MYGSLINYLIIRENSPSFYAECIQQLFTIGIGKVRYLLMLIEYNILALSSQT